MRPTIVLYDVDGTLVSSGGAGRVAVEHAFELALGAPATLAFSFAGMTDRAIVRGGLRANGHPDDESTIDRVLALYLELLPAEVARAEGYLVHAGITSSIEALRAMPDVAIGLGTGNVEPGARIKLDRVGLNEHFEFGGFGCDAEDRAALIAVGAQRGAQRLGRPRADCRLIIIGDTPKDAAAAHANGGECVAVATGGNTRDELEACGARWVFDDLSGVSLPDLLGLR